jgi:integrase
MGTREANGRSSIYFGADGCWHGYVSMGVRADGRLDRRHVKRKTKASATEAVRKLEKERDTGRATSAGRSPMVAEWLTTYLDTIAVQKLAPKTLDDYRSLVNTWIIPHLGKRRLNSLDTVHIDALYSKMLESGLAASTILKVHRILSRALKIAVRRRKLGHNVAEFVDPPSVLNSEQNTLTLDQVHSILKVAMSRPNGVRWAIGLTCGLRQGETLGLRWEYVDLDTGDMRIWWQIQRIRWRHGCADRHECGARLHRKPCKRGCTRHKNCPQPCPPRCTRHASSCPQRHGGGLVLRSPKGKSRRIVRLPSPVLALLREHKIAQDQHRAALGTAWTNYDLVFCQPNGRPIDPRRDWDEWAAILSAAGLPHTRLHDGRHTAGTLLIGQDVHLRVVQEILGHTDIRVTQKYTHVSSATARDAADRIGAALWPERP